MSAILGLWLISGALAWWLVADAGCLKKLTLAGLAALVFYLTVGPIGLFVAISWRSNRRPPFDPQPAIDAALASIDTEKVRFIDRNLEKMTRRDRYGDRYRPTSWEEQ